MKHLPSCVLLLFGLALIPATTLSSGCAGCAPQAEGNANQPNDNPLDGGSLANTNANAAPDPGAGAHNPIDSGQVGPGDQVSDRTDPGAQPTDTTPPGGNTPPDHQLPPDDPSPPDDESPPDDPSPPDDQSPPDDPTPPDDVPPLTNIPPVANSQVVLVPYESSIVITLSASDPDTATEAISYSVAEAVRYGSLVAVASNQVAYRPNLGFSGEDSFTFIASDGVNQSVASTVTLQVAERPAGENPHVHTWHSAGTGLSHTGPVSVAALCAVQQELVAGGLFTSAGGAPVVNVAGWQSDQWTALGAELNTEVRALHVYNGQLFAGVLPALQGGAALYAWDGLVWAPHANAFDWSGTIHGMAVFQGELWLTGDFTRVGEHEISRLARWNGVTIAGVGSGLRDTHPGSAPFAVGLALLQTPERLYVAGAFDMVDTVAAENIASWDGQQWRALGAGTEGIVFALAEYQGGLVAGGSFASAGGVPAGGIARWNGAVWQPLGGGVDVQNAAYVRALAEDGAHLYAGGHFSTVGATAAGNIACWDGQDWRGLGSGIAGTSASGVGVQSLLIHGPELIAGGDFTQAGGVSASGVARWRITP